MRLHVSVEPGASRDPGLTTFNMTDRESQSMAAALIVKAASESLVRFFLAMLGRVGTIRR